MYTNGQAREPVDLDVLRPRQSFRHPEVDPVESAMAEIIDYLPDVARQLISIALTSDSERMRLEASRYVIDKFVTPALGKLNADDPMARLLADCVSELNG